MTWQHLANMKLSRVVQSINLIIDLKLPFILVFSFSLQGVTKASLSNQNGKIVNYSTIFFLERTQTLPLSYDGDSTKRIECQLLFSPSPAPALAMIIQRFIPLKLRPAQLIFIFLRAQTTNIRIDSISHTTNALKNVLDRFFLFHYSRIQKETSCNLTLMLSTIAFCRSRPSHSNTIELEHPWNVNRITTQLCFIKIIDRG